MLKSPTKIHHLHKFRHNNKLYIADLDQFRLIEVDQIAWDVVELSPTLETDALIAHLKTDSNIMSLGDVAQLHRRQARNEISVGI